MKTLKGKVVSTKMAKTIVVAVKRQRIHPLYKKIMSRTKKYKAHCEDINIQLGETVKIVETRPFSKDKHYRLLESVK